MAEIDVINRLLKERGISGAELCRQIGVSSGVYSQWNKGRSGIKPENLKKIADYLKVSVGYLLGEEQEKTPPETGERTISDEDIQAAFWGGYKGLTQEQIDAMWQDVREYAAYIAEKERKKNK